MGAGLARVFAPGKAASLEPQAAPPRPTSKTPKQGAVMLKTTTAVMVAATVAAAAGWRTHGPTRACAANSSTRFGSKVSALYNQRFRIFMLRLDYF